jgi:type VII secretion protein EccE
MKEQSRIGVTLSWARLTGVFLIDVAVLALASHWPGDANHIAFWVGVAVAVVVTVIGLVTYRRNTLASALSARVLDRFADPQAMLTAGRTPAVNHQRRYGRDVVGMREYQGRLVSAIAVEAREEPAGRHHHREASLAGLPLDAVVNRLRQFDVRLDEIDIVSVATQSADADEHRTWVLVRLDPQRNVAAVAARDSLAATLAAATERLALDLDEGRLTARPVTADEFADLDAAVLAGLQPAHVRARRRRLRYDEPTGSKEYVTSFWVSPDDITSDTLQQLWEPETNATAVTVKLVARRGGADVSVWVRYHSADRLPKEVWSGLNRLTGRQLSAVLASLPVPATRPPLAVPGRSLAHHEQLSVPVGAAAPTLAPTPAGARW